MQIQLLHCVDSLLEVTGNNCATVGYELFTTLISIMALHRSDSIKDEVSDGLLTNEIHWIPITTSKKIQKKLFVTSGCSL